MEVASIQELFPNFPLYDFSTGVAGIDVEAFFQQLQNYNDALLIGDIVKKEPKKRRNHCEIEKKKIYNPNPTFVDVSPYLQMSQHKAAKILGVASSTFSKRFKEASNGRKWPCRILNGIEKKIQALLKNKHLGNEIDVIIAELMKEKQKNLEKVYVRID